MHTPLATKLEPQVLDPATIEKSAAFTPPGGDTTIPVTVAAVPFDTVSVMGWLGVLRAT